MYKSLLFRNRGPLKVESWNPENLDISMIWISIYRCPWAQAKLDKYFSVGNIHVLKVTVDLIWMKKTVLSMSFDSLNHTCWYARYGDMPGRHIGQGRLQGFFCTLILWIVLVDIPAFPGRQRCRRADCKDSWIYFVKPLCNTSLILMLLKVTEKHNIRYRYNVRYLLCNQYTNM